MTNVPAQGGILEGANPTQFNPSNPVILFIIQAGIILIFCSMLAWPLSKIRQPRVIAEIIGGILLGPSVLGRVPNFTNTIFPIASMPTLNTAANIGLILFLFIVGLEVDLRLLVKNWRIALSVGLAGMALPFGLGCAIAYGLYHEFRDEPGLMPIAFGTYMLFIGVAMAITAFPVLCRILTECNLLQTQVGIVVLSAGIGNDVVGWILLALCVALVNAGSGITALYVLLVCVGWVLFLVYVVRPLFLWYLRRTHSLTNGPSQSVVALTVLMVLTSAFFTGVCGVHPIFGAFMVGLICPHDGGFAIKMTEKIEDLVGVFLLPLYFALSGLSTNIGLLDTGITWAYVVGVIAVAFFGKFVGGTLAARVNKMLWRESCTCGVLMSCKGLVELIVLNIGYQAKILSQRTFTIFVVMALVTTFATTPLTLALFPAWYQRKAAAFKRGEITWDGKPVRAGDTEGSEGAQQDKSRHEIRRLLVSLRLESLPSLFMFLNLFGGSAEDKKEVDAGLAVIAEDKIHPTLRQRKTATTSEGNQQHVTAPRPVEVHGTRLLELTERLSSVMKESEAADDWSARDPVVNAFQTFGQLHNVAVSGDVACVPDSSHADVLADRAGECRSDIIFLPWSASGSSADPNSTMASVLLSSRGQPAGGYSHAYTDLQYNTFVRRLQSTAPCSTAVYLDHAVGTLGNGSEVSWPEQHVHSPVTLRKRARSTLSARSATAGDGQRYQHQQSLLPPLGVPQHHIFMPFFGGRDDHVALRLVLRLARNPIVTATIVYFQQQQGDVMSTIAESEEGDEKTGAIVAHVSAHVHPGSRRDGEPTPNEDLAVFTEAREALSPQHQSRIMFDTVTVTSSPHIEANSRNESISTVDEKPGTSSSETATSSIAAGRAGARSGGATRVMLERARHEFLDLAASSTVTAETKMVIVGRGRESHFHRLASRDRTLISASATAAVTTGGEARTSAEHLHTSSPSSSPSSSHHASVQVNTTLVQTLGSMAEAFITAGHILTCSSSSTDAAAAGAGAGMARAGLLVVQAGPHRT